MYGGEKTNPGHRVEEFTCRPERGASAAGLAMATHSFAMAIFVFATATHLFAQATQAPYFHK